MADEPKNDVVVKELVNPPGEPEPGEPRTADEIATQILNDADLSAADYRDLRNNPDKLKKLVDRKLEKPVEPKAADAEPKDDKLPEPKAADVEPKADDRVRKGGFQRKIDKLTDRVYQSQSELEQERQRAATLEAQLTALRTGAPRIEEPKEPADKPEPKIEDFGTSEEYLRAVAKHEATQLVETALAKQREEDLEAIKEHRTQRQRQDAELATTTRNQAWAKQVVTLRDKHDDFDEVVFDSQLPLSEPMEHAVLNSPHGAELAYWLGTNPDECERIARLPALEAIMELGGITSQLARESQPKATADGNAAGNKVPSEPKKSAASKAPAPPKSTVGGDSGKSVKDYAYYDKASLREYMEARNSGALR